MIPCTFTASAVIAFAVSFCARLPGHRALSFSLPKHPTRKTPTNIALPELFATSFRCPGEYWRKLLKRQDETRACRRINSFEWSAPTTTQQCHSRSLRTRLPLDQLPEHGTAFIRSIASIVLAQRASKASSKDSSEIQEAIDPMHAPLELQNRSNTNTSREKVAILQQASARELGACSTYRKSPTRLTMSLPAFMLRAWSSHTRWTSRLCTTLCDSNYSGTWDRRLVR